MLFRYQDLPDDVRLLLQRERFQDDALRLHGQGQGWQGLQPGGNELLYGQSGEILS